MNKISRLKKILQRLDIFGRPISFYIKGNTKYKTAFGGIFTVIISIVIFIVTIVAFISLINRSNMIATQQNTYTINPPFLNLTQETFMFSLGVFDSSITLNNSLFSFTAFVYYINQTSGDEKVSPISLRPCRLEDYNNTVYELHFQFQNYLCPENSSYGILGTLTNEVYQIVGITAAKCVNGTNPYVTCASNEFISNYFQKYGNILLILNFMNRVANLQDRKNPFTTFIDVQYWIVNPFSELKYDTNLYFRANQLSSHDDIFGISSPNIYNVITYDKERVDNMVIQSQNSTNFLVISLISSNYQNFYTRSYDDFLQVLSYIGGILNLLTMITGVIVGIFDDYKYRMRMCNELYDFDLSEYTTDMNNQHIVYELNETNSLSTKMYMNGQYDNTLVKQKFDKMKSMRSRLAFKVLEFWKYIFYCCKSKFMKFKIELFNLADKQLAKDMDIIWLIKKIQDIDKLKTILLYPDKLKIFEFIPPPIMSTNKPVKDHHEIVKYMRKNIVTKDDPNLLFSWHECDNIYHNLAEYYKYSDAYENLKIKKDQASQNIIRSLDPEITEIFDCIEKNAQELDQTNYLMKKSQIIKDQEVSLVTNEDEDHKQNMEAKEINILPPTIIRNLDHSSSFSALAVNNVFIKHKDSCDLKLSQQLQEAINSGSQS